VLDPPSAIADGPAHAFTEASPDPATVLLPEDAAIAAQPEENDTTPAPAPSGGRSSAAAETTGLNRGGQARPAAVLSDSGRGTGPFAETAT
jgi:hypothetical protein